MNIKIKGTYIELTPAITSYVHDKLTSLSKLLSDVDGALIQIEVGKDSEHHNKGDIFKAEIRVYVRGKDYHAVITKDDLYAAIDEMKDEIMEKVKSEKDKANSLYKRGARQVKNFIKGIWKK